MVKVVGLTKEEILLNQKCKKLEEIVLEKFKDMEINAATRPYHFSIFLEGKHLASVYPDKNKIDIGNPKDYDLAYAIAEQFEEKTKTEWILKERYNE